jgi:hypothetical protein
MAVLAQSLISCCKPIQHALVLHHSQNSTTYSKPRNGVLLPPIPHSPCAADALMADTAVIKTNTTWGTWDSRDTPMAADPEDDLMAAAAPEAKQAARLAAASGAATVLSCLTQQLDLVEHCAGVVLLHFVQVRGWPQPRHGPPGVCWRPVRLLLAALDACL